MTVNTISSNSTRQELIAYIQTADDQLITAMNAMAEAYETKNERDIIDEAVNVDDLPSKLKERIEVGMQELREGKKATHTDVMGRINQKYGL